MKAKQAGIEGGDGATLKAISVAPVFLTGVAPDLHRIARDKLIEMHPDAKSATDALK